LNLHLNQLLLYSLILWAEILQADRLRCWPNRRDAPPRRSLSYLASLRTLGCRWLLARVVDLKSQSRDFLLKFRNGRSAILSCGLLRQSGDLLLKLKYLRVIARTHAARTQQHAKRGHDSCFHCPPLLLLWQFKIYP